MIDLVLFVCLLTAPDDCRKERIAFDGGLFACATAGQFAAAEWINSHPRWRVVRWSCGPTSRDT
jgi:hypothetical protein